MRVSRARNLNRLFNFYLVATSGPSMKEAARRLGVSLPTVSESLKRLQDEMGADLMHPGLRKTILDAPGEELLRKIGPGMEVIERYFVEEKLIEPRANGEPQSENLQADCHVPESEGRDELLPGHGSALASPEDLA
jgi:hypothetical protein